MTARVMVAGSVGLDRIWRLDGRLRTGARLTRLDRTLRMGGGAANTAAVLQALGRAPAIAAAIATDAAGDGLVAALAGAGLDLSGIARPPGETVPSDIFLDPAGERTLIARATAPRALPAAVLAGAWDVLYLNIARLADPVALAAFHDRLWVIAQLPLDLDEPRPADALIASRSDIGDLPAEALWQRRRALAGDALRCIIVTDGGGGAEIVDAGGARHLPITSAPLTADSIGAGDFFAAGLIDALLDQACIDQAVRHAQCVAARFLQARPAMLRSFGPG